MQINGKKKHKAFVFIFIWIGYLSTDFVPILVTEPNFKSYLRYIIN